MSHDRITLPIAAIRQENSSLCTFTFNAPLKANPGQFVMLTIFGQGEKPFSIQGVTDSSFSMTIKNIGPLTARLFQMNIGDLISFRGPYGRPFSTQTGRILMVGGGYATPPLRFQAEILRENGVKYLVNINGAQVMDDLLYVSDFKDICDRSLVATDDGSLGYAGTSVDVMRNVLKEDHFDYIYISGPEKMMKAAAELANQHKVPFEVNLERYMKCGIGICGSCVMDPSGFILCVEGPVVDHRNLEKLTEFGVSHRDKTGKIQSI